MTLCLLLTMTFAARAAPSPTAKGVTLREIRSMLAQKIGVTRPGGIGFSPAAEAFLVIDEQVGGARINWMDRRGDPLGPATSISGAFDPVNVAFDHVRQRLVLFDSAANELVVIAAGPDGALDPASLVRRRPQALGPVRVAGIALDEQQGSVYLLDRLSKCIFEIAEQGGGNGTEPSWTVVSRVTPADLVREELYGMTFNPANRHFYLISTGSLALHEVTETGSTFRDYDLGALGIVEPRGLVFAPSGDRTDPPSTMSLYLADRGGGEGPPNGRIVELEFRSAARSRIAIEAVTPTTLVRITDMSRFTPPSPDPSGIATTRCVRFC